MARTVLKRWRSPHTGRTVRKVEHTGHDAYLQNATIGGGSIYANEGPHPSRVIVLETKDAYGNDVRTIIEST